MCRTSNRVYFLLLLLSILHRSCIISSFISSSSATTKVRSDSPSHDTYTYTYSTFSTRHHTHDLSSSNQDEHDEQPNEQDTIRVRIWQALSSNGELSMKQLGTIVGERRLGDLKSHLTHVQRQAKTFGNKSKEWKERRGLKDGVKGVKIKTRVEKGLVYIRLD